MVQKSYAGTHSVGHHVEKYPTRVSSHMAKKLGGTQIEWAKEW